MQYRRFSRGFSLVELMITLVIVAIIAAIAYPAYTAQVQGTRQSAMQGDMMSFAATLENYRAQNFSYDGADALPTPSNDFYTVTLDVAANNRSYVILATPIGSMVGTGAMGLNERGGNCLLKSNDSSCTVGTDPGWKK